MRRLAVVPALAGVCLVGACSGLPNEKVFALGGVDANSSVAAEVAAASHAPGPYPRFADIPNMPTDVRPASAWKSAVTREWSDKLRLQASAAAIPFTLNGTDAFAASTMARINPADAVQAPADARAQAEAYAADQAARATPPPASK